MSASSQASAGMVVRARQSGRLRAEILRQTKLPAAVREEMWQLFRRYYDAVTREAFESDLAKKQDVIVMRDSGDGSLQGFSTLFVFDERVDGERVIAIFSGDTIIDDAYWGQQALQRAFLRYMVMQKLKNPRASLYWFLISKGFRTYLLLSRNFPNYWPRHDAPTPARESKVLDALSTALYPDAWKPELGLLRFEECAGKLKRGVAPIDLTMLTHEDIAFFAQKNPRHADGDELCCLGKVDAALLVAAPLRLMKKALLSLLRVRERPALPSRVNSSS